MVYAHAWVRYPIDPCVPLLFRLYFWMWFVGPIQYQIVCGHVRPLLYDLLLTRCRTVSKSLASPPRFNGDLFLFFQSRSGHTDSIESSKVDGDRGVRAHIGFFLFSFSKAFCLTLVFICPKFMVFLIQPQFMFYRPWVVVTWAWHRIRQMFHVLVEVSLLGDWSLSGLDIPVFLLLFDVLIRVSNLVSVWRRCTPIFLLCFDKIDVGVFF